MRQASTQFVTEKKGLQGLSEGWVVSKRGLGIRADIETGAMLYHVAFWTEGALSPEIMGQWDDIKKAHAEESAALGQKGAYGKLASLNKETDAKLDYLILGSLENGCGAKLSESDLRLMADALSNTEAIELAAACVFDNHVRVLFSLCGECGVDALVAEWKKSVSSAAWCDGLYARSISPVNSIDMADAMTQALGTVIASVSPQGESDASRQDESFHHVTVLLNEAVDMLAPAEGKLIVDATLGGGGHTELMLERGATVWGIDQDPDARRAATARLSRFGGKFKALAGNFREVKELLAVQGVDRVDGLLADLGVSSHQVDTAERGFSFRENGPLDMRMGPAIKKSAADLVNEADEKTLADIIWQYGEERASRPIARAIVKARANGRIETTGQLADIVSSVLPRKGKQHPATRTFQALRIAVNDELGALDQLLESSVDVLGKGGRLAVITFHSLEDRRVKQFLDLRSRPEIDRKEWPAPRPNPDYVFKLLNKKPIVASDREVSENTRSRSAKLRGAEKII